MACSTGTPPSPASSPTCRSSSTTRRPAPPSTSRRRPSPGSAASTTTSWASRRRRRTSSTSPGSCTSPGTRQLVWSGIELLCLPLLALGGAGFVSATANLAPAAIARMYQHWEAGELDKAREIHFGLHPVTDAIFTETNPAAAKWVLAQAAIIGSGYVPPAAGPADRSGPAHSPADAEEGRLSPRRPRRATGGLSRDVEQYVRLGFAPARGRPATSEKRSPRVIPDQISALHRRAVRPERRRRDVRGRRPGVQPGVRAVRGRRPPATLTRP